MGVTVRKEKELRINSSVRHDRGHGGCGEGGPLRPGELCSPGGGTRSLGVLMGATSGAAGRQSLSGASLGLLAPMLGLMFQIR